jgi:phosphopantothenoylcysteine decarboxylase/phosphopantothenate--cysteine ligase
MHVLITAGPTREYIDDVRFISNASSGRMGYALADACLRRGWQVTLVTGPVSLALPQGATVRRVMSAAEMLDLCLDLFAHVDGVVAVAAVADYRPATRYPGKLHRSGGPLEVRLIPNPDILAELGRRRTRQWIVGFAVEPFDQLDRARQKLAEKNCDAIVANEPAAMESAGTTIQLLDRSGVIFRFDGPKDAAAERIVGWISDNLVRSTVSEA